MTAKELKKLSRRDLLEILLEQSRQMQSLQEQLEEAQAKLDDRQLKLDKAGSIAEAALQLNGVYEAAEAACQQYIESMKERSQRQDAICQKMEQECQQKIRQRLAETEQTRNEMLELTKRQCAEILTKARAMARGDGQ